MRLSNKLVHLIVDAARSSFGHVEIILFGSRVDDSKKGGDIDLAIKGCEDADLFKQGKIKFRTSLYRKGYDLKIDLVRIHSTMDELLKREIENEGLKLG